MDVELVVRGSCCLIAGVPGVTDNITVRSIVGRYLELQNLYLQEMMMSILLLQIS